jgi:hypothetical protein
MSETRFNRLALIYISRDLDVKVDSGVDEISKSNCLRIFYVVILADF